MIYNDIKDALSRFAFRGVYRDAEEMHSGNVNATYHLYFEDGESERDYVLQQINSFVFREPEKVMQNIVKVTEHLKASAHGTESRTLSCIPLITGGYLYCDGDGHYWRAYDYICGATAYDRVERPEHFFEVGRAFGEFQNMLSDFSTDDLFETIPDFHNTRRRFYDFVASVAEDRGGRAAKCEEEIDFFFDRRKMMDRLVRRIEDGRIPVRVAHNDTKINNVMIDDETGHAVCVIDLDTVMAGSALFDYGDAIRFGASTAAEDEEDLSRIHLDMDLFSQFTRGYLGCVGNVLTEEEKRCMPLSILVMTCELAMRFLKDYIDGDCYFRVRGPKHNLIRARAQMCLLKDMESKFEMICRETNEIMRTTLGENGMVSEFAVPWDRH